jgi:condensin complex subunit 2
MDSDQPPTAGPSRPLIPFDPRVPNQQELVMAMSQGGGEMLDYFDTNFMKNWAGPEHWKIRRVVKKAPDPEQDEGLPKAKREKQTFQIAFLDPATIDVSAKQLFISAKPTTIALPATSGATLPSVGRSRSKRINRDTSRKDTHLLPDDMHFSSQQLLRLFLKPKFTLKMRRQGPPTGADGEVDEHFWARQAAEQAATSADMDDDTQGDGGIPFDTQFFHDDGDDGPGFDDDMDMGDMGMGFSDEVGHRSLEEEDLLAATQGQQVRRVRPEFIQYAKKAKRVDVKKLKENIWKSLEIVAENVEEEDEVSDIGTDVDDKL